MTAENLVTAASGPPPRFFAASSIGEIVVLRQAVDLVVRSRQLTLKQADELLTELRDAKWTADRIQARKWDADGWVQVDVLGPKTILVRHAGTTAKMRQIRNSKPHSCTACHDTISNGAVMFVCVGAAPWMAPRICRSCLKYGDAVDRILSMVEISPEVSP